MIDYQEYEFSADEEIKKTILLISEFKSAVSNYRKPILIVNNEQKRETLSLVHNIDKFRIFPYLDLYHMFYSYYDSNIVFEKYNYKTYAKIMGIKFDCVFFDSFSFGAASLEMLINLDSSGIDTIIKWCPIIPVEWDQISQENYNFFSKNYPEILI